MKIVLCLALCLALTQGYSSKIESSLKGRAQADVLVYLTGHASTLSHVRSTFNARTTRQQKSSAVAKALKALNQESVSQISGLLAKSNYKSYWVANMVSIPGASAAMIEALAAHPKVDHIIENGMAYAIDEVHEVQGTPRWGTDHIQCHQVDNQGAGAIVGVIDTGTRATHETLREQYRAEYGFYDAVNGRHDVSYDDNGHGTHCTGTVLGSGTDRIGCAPLAQWIACKGLSASGGGSFAQLVECAEFMACPDNEAEDCTTTPDLVSNSWGGGGGGVYYDEVINTWHAMNIIPVFAAGNSGGCRTILSPADSRSGTISVGATDSSDRLASFSSRGPDNWGNQAPDISAPGVNVVSAGHGSDTARATMSGTSMACPHAAGVLALMRSKNPLIGWEDAKAALEESASENVNGSGASCDGVPDSQWPNYHFGYGIINAPGAVNLA